MAKAENFLRSVTLIDLPPPPIGVPIGPLKSSPVLSTTSIAWSEMPEELPRANSFSPISAGTKSMWSITPAALKMWRTASMISGPIPSPGVRAIFSFLDIGLLSVGWVVVRWAVSMPVLSAFRKAGKSIIGPRPADLSPV